MGTSANDPSDRLVLRHAHVRGVVSVHPWVQAKQLEVGKIAAEVATPKKTGGMGAKIVKSLSFSRRKKTPKPAIPEDVAQEDLISARGANPQSAMLLGTPKNTEPTGGGPGKRRSLSFTRRKKEKTELEKV